MLVTHGSPTAMLFRISQNFVAPDPHKGWPLAVYTCIFILTERKPSVGDEDGEGKTQSKGTWIAPVVADSDHLAEVEGATRDGGSSKQEQST